jgi:hypothetical protein
LSAERGSCSPKRKRPDAELFLSPASAHLFTDRSWEEYDEAATTLVTRMLIG